MSNYLSPESNKQNINKRPFMRFAAAAAIIASSLLPMNTLTPDQAASAQIRKPEVVVFKHLFGMYGAEVLVGHGITLYSSPETNQKPNNIVTKIGPQQNALISNGFFEVIGNPVDNSWTIGVYNGKLVYVNDQELQNYLNMYAYGPKGAHYVDITAVYKNNCLYTPKGKAANIIYGSSQNIYYRLYNINANHHLVSINKNLNIINKNEPPTITN